MLWAAALAGTGTLAGGCPVAEDTARTSPIFKNTTDPTNAGASFSGPAPCAECHRDIAEQTRRHAHDQTGVDCETCHGPGSRHVLNPQARDLFVDSSVQTCGRCHTAGDDPEVILAAGGFISANTQYAELRASGGHARFKCTICHDPHASTVNDRTVGVRNDCRLCHRDQSMTKIHEGVVFTRGDYAEALSCESCHMPFASGSASTNAPPDVAGVGARVADTRTHVFRIRPAAADYSAMFSADGTRVLEDEQGRAAITVDFVCLRCHNGAGSAPAMGVPVAGWIAAGMHDQ